VVSKEEVRVPAGEGFRLRDAETGELVEVRLDAKGRERFQAAAEAFLKDREALAARHGARLCRVEPDSDLIAAVERIVVGAR
jgi:hypothetical protein